VIFGLTHVELPVLDLARARALWSEEIGLAVVHEGPGFVEVDGGSLGIRLVAAPEVTHRAVLHLQASEVEVATARLVSAGCALLQGPLRLDGTKLEARVELPDGHVVVLWRDLSEDELDAPPKLPTTTAWAPDAVEALNALLAVVPAPFRDLARRAAVKRAEQGCPPEGVDRRRAAAGFYQATPAFMRSRAHAPLRELGFDPARLGEGEP